MSQILPRAQDNLRKNYLTYAGAALFGLALSFLLPAPETPVAADAQPVGDLLLQAISLVWYVVAALIAHLLYDRESGWRKTHARWQVRTFWISILLTIGMTLIDQYLLQPNDLSEAFMPVLMVMVTFWELARCGRGIAMMKQGRPLPNPASVGWT